MRRLIQLLLLSLFLSCNNKNSNNKVLSYKDTLVEKANYVKRVISFNALNDTDKVIINISGQQFTVKYYKNKPQYVTVNNEKIGKDISVNEFAKANQGAYISFEPDSDVVRSFGLKYLDGHSGIDVIVRPNSQSLKYLNLWKEYTNDGMQYDFSKIEDGKIKAYKYQGGGIVDSFIFQKK